MNVIETEIDYNILTNEIGVEVEILPMLFDALKRECDHLIPLLTDAVLIQNFSEMHQYAHALKGIIGNMRLDDLYAIATSLGNAAKAENQTYLYEENLLILKNQLENLFTKFYSHFS